MKTSDIDTVPILELLLVPVENMCGYTTFDDCKSSINKAFPKDTPFKLIISKMRSLIKKGLVSGCYCGCRGDFEITQKGIEFLKTQ